MSTAAISNISKKQLFFFLFLIISSEGYSQIVFEKGYYILNSGERVECLIKNKDAANNPIDFKYKLSKEGDQRIQSIQAVKEFGIYEVSRYVKHKIAIDRSSERTNELSTLENPVFKTEELFLNVLIEGEATLFVYADSGLRRYFYKTTNSNVAQLIYKSYVDHNGKIRKNTGYRKQLWDALKCTNVSLDQIKKTEYKLKDLSKLFVQYNQCQGGDLVNYREKPRKASFHLAMRPGWNSSQLKLDNPSFSRNFRNRDIDFGKESSFRFGIEAEIVLPLNKNKWAIIVEPTYQSYKSTSQFTFGGQPVGVALDAYKSIELPFGIRHYFFLNKNSRLFLNAAFVLDFSFASEIEFEQSNPAVPDGTLEIGSRSNFAFGFGYKYARFSLEYRYGAGREVLSDSNFAWSSNFTSSSFIVGYTLF